MVLTVKRAGDNILTLEYLSYYVQDQLGFWCDWLRATLAGHLSNYESSSYDSKTKDRVFSPRAVVSFYVT